MRAQRILMAVLALFGTASLSAQTSTVLENFEVFECTGASSATYTCHLSIRIENKRGVEDANFVSYCSPDCELKKFSGTVTDSFGKVLTKIKRSDLNRTEYSSHFATDDYRFFYGIDEPLKYPITVTYDWEVEYKNVIINYPDFIPLGDYEIALDTASYRFIQRPENTMEYRVVNFEPEIKVTENDGKGRRITEFSVSHLKHLEKHTYGQTFRERMPRVYIVPKQFDWKKTHCDMTDWNTFGQWIWTLNQGRDVLTPEVKEKLHQATDTCTSDRSKVAAARKVLGDMTRYVSIQLGIGGYQTATAEEVCTRGIGDCKALSNCFCAMLHELGIPAVYTLIDTNERHLLKDMPNFNQLNHVIVQIPLPGDTLWVECTNSLHPVEYRHTDMCGHEVVLITPEGGKLYTIPEYPDNLNHHKKTVDIRLSPDGSAKLDYLETDLNSYFETMLGMQQMSLKEQRDKMLRRIDIKNMTIDSLETHFEGTRADIKMKLTGAAFAKWSNNRIFLPATIDGFSPLSNTKEEAHPIDLVGCGLLWEQEMIYHIPEGYEMESKLAPLKIDSPFGQFTRTFELKEACLYIRESYSVKNGLYPAESYNDWVAFRKALAESSKKKVVLKKSAN